MTVSRGFTCAFALAVAPLAARAQVQSQVASLRGIGGVVVVIDSVQPGLAAAIDTAALRRSVESKLRGYGIEPLSALHTGPSLHLSVTGAHSADSHMWALSAHLEVAQSVKLERSPHEGLLTPTWESRAATGIAGDARIREEVNTLTDSVLDQFFNAWMFANPPCR